MALTPFGKALRKLRIDRDLLLKDMAAGAGVTPAFLSAVESGRKPIPSHLINRISNWIKLDGQEEAQLRDEAALSAPSVTFSFGKGTSLSDRSLVMQLARNFEDLNDEQKQAIQSIFDRRKA